LVQIPASFTPASEREFAERRNGTSGPSVADTGSGWLADWFEAIVSNVHSSTPAWLRSPDGRFLLANDAFARTVGASTAGTVIRRLDAAVVGEQRARRLGRHGQHILESGDTRIFLEAPGAIDHDPWCVTVRFPARSGTEAVAAVALPITDWLSIERRARPAVNPPNRPAWLRKVLAAVDLRVSPSRARPQSGHPLRQES
jgi:hypothetical protein